MGTGANTAFDRLLRSTSGHPGMRPIFNGSQALTTSLAQVGQRVRLNAGDWAQLSDLTAQYRVVAEVGNYLDDGDAVEVDLYDDASDDVYVSASGAIDITNGSVVADASGNGYHGVLTGAPTIASSPFSGFGNALACDGVTGASADVDGLDCGEIPIWTTGGCLEAKFRATAGGTDAVIGGQWDGTGANRLLVYRTSGNKVAAILQRANGTLAIVTGATTISTNTNYTVCADWDGSFLRLFLNGSEENAASAVTDVATATGVRFRVGRHGDVSGGYAPFPGTIDEVRLSSATRHTVNYTPDATPFADDGSTQVLLHMDALANPYSVHRYATAWANFPGSAVGPYLRARNSTSARGSILSAWMEVRYL